jgi:hypothetical protein
MAFVRDLIERLRHPGVHTRGHALTLSDHVEELRERQEPSHREQSRRRQARPKPRQSKRQRSKRETATPAPASADPSAAAEGEAGRRWVPRSS